MKKLTTVLLVPVLAVFLFGAFAVLPADAAEIQDSCTLSKGINLKNSSGNPVSINDGVTVISSDTVSIKDLSGSQAGTGTPPTLAIKEWGTICLVNTINAVTDWIFFVLISVAFIFILIAGFMWMVGRGEPEKQKQAGQMIAAALVGIVIAILARIIPAVVIGILS